MTMSRLAAALLSSWRLSYICVDPDNIVLVGKSFVQTHLTNLPPFIARVSQPNILFRSAREGHR